MKRRPGLSLIAVIVLARLSYTVLRTGYLIADLEVRVILAITLTATMAPTLKMTKMRQD